MQLCMVSFASLLRRLAGCVSTGAKGDSFTFTFPPTWRGAMAQATAESSDSLFNAYVVRPSFKDRMLLNQPNYYLL